ncbi:uncharacterized protein LOC122368530 isoform X3 [Amphibalanus amphitrite]|uniref:uncharacterized protein LOC122368530 isoform X3 n=1 Tax=Amphibalanus amphitrite TaxID=1232801 RepID=UPI001C91CA09|nr:uncharacterized protein LOC122368530 isoform X3 [Amphibalanus amphitrite]
MIYRTSMMKEPEKQEKKEGPKSKMSSSLKHITCVMPGCGKTKENSPESSFFDFPKDPAQLNAWRQHCTNKKLLANKPPKLCSAHFDKKDVIEKPTGVSLRTGALPLTKVYISMVQRDKPKPVQVARKQSSSKMPEPVKKTPAEFYLDLVVEKPKPPGTNRSNRHSSAGPPFVAEREANKENRESVASPPPPPPPPPCDEAVTSPPSSPPVCDEGPGWDSEPAPTPAPSTRPNEIRVVVNKMPPGHSTTNPSGSRVLPDPPGKIDVPNEAKLTLPDGALTKYLIELRAKQLQINDLQKNYNSLVEKVQFRNNNPDWPKDIPEQSLDGPILTLRDGQHERDPPLEKVNLLSPEVLMPQTPNNAWHAIVGLRKEILDLQVALMYSRIQVKYRELRLQEVTAEHRRYKVAVRAKQRKTDREEQQRENRIKQLERRCDLTSSNCSEWRLKTKMAEKTGIKKKRRNEMLVKGLEQIFTPMQLRVIRTGCKARWAEEDIRRAIELKKLVTRRGYAFIRNTMKIPLPSPKMMKLGASRFESLKHVYEQMVTANLLKYSTKKKPKVVKKDDHAYEVDPRAFETNQDELDVDLGITNRRALTREAPSEDPASSAPAQRKPVKRRRKRVTAQPSMPIMDTMDVEFEDMGVVGRAFNPGSTARAPKRPRTAWSETRPSWESSRIWGDDQVLGEYEQTNVDRRQRPQPTWSAETDEFL